MPTPIDAAYSLDRERITWLGLRLTEGLAEGDDCISEALDGDAGWKQKANGIGGAIQTYNPSTRGIMSLKISCEHPVHLALKVVCNVDKQFRDRVGPMMYRRGSGELIKYENARIVREPDEKRGTNPGEVEWQWIFSRKVSYPPGAQENIVEAA